MDRSVVNLLFLALPPYCASIVVLALASVSWSLWVQHILAGCLACVIALVGARMSSVARIRFGLAAAVVVGALVCLIAPLYASNLGPTRWIQLGRFNLYVAPTVLPAFFLAVSALLGSERLRWLAFVGPISVGALLAIQPDASQALAILVAITVTYVGARSRVLASGVTVGLLSLATAWSFSRPDPLEPVPYVEGVFFLALQHSTLAGAAVIACAIAMVVGLYVFSLRGYRWLSALASYYAVLFACSVAGLTPAPLIGYGAGPLLGFGLMVAMSSWLATRTQSKELIKMPLRDQV